MLKMFYNPIIHSILENNTNTVVTEETEMKPVTVLFRINSTINAIEIAQGEAECYFNCLMSVLILTQVTRALIVGQL